MSNGIFNTVKSYLPYGIVAYALFGGTGAEHLYDIDNNAANNFVQHMQQQDPSKGMDVKTMRDQISKTFKVKMPNDFSVNSVKVFMDDVAAEAKRAMTGDNYGY